MRTPAEIAYERPFSLITKTLARPKHKMPPHEENCTASLAPSIMASEL